MESEQEWMCSVYHQYMPLLRWIARKKGILFDDIDDAVQETFYRFQKNYPIPIPETDTKRLLAAIMRNLCTDYHRDRQKHLGESAWPEDDSCSIAQEFRRQTDVLEQVMVNQELRDTLLAMRSMKAEWLEVFILYIIEGRDMEEVARMMGISTDTGRMRLHRGRAYLEKMLKKKPAENKLKTRLSELLKKPENPGETELSGDK